MTSSRNATPAATPRTAPWKVRRHHAALVGLALLAGSAFGAWRLNHSSQAAADPAAAIEVLAPTTSRAVETSAQKNRSDTAETTTPPAPTAAEQRRQQLLGSWRDQYYGERTMTFREDGTGTMTIKLDAIGRLLIGERLRFDLTWEDRDGVLVMQFTGGEPKDAVARISKDFGDRHEQRIELLTDQELHLRSTDSHNLYTLKRVEE